MSDRNSKVSELTEEEMDCVTGGDGSGSCGSCRFVTSNKTDQCMRGISGSCSGYCLCYGSVDCTGGHHRGRLSCGGFTPTHYADEYSWVAAANEQPEAVTDLLR